jgi:TorA maturation chaperone TorD
MPNDDHAVDELMRGECFRFLAACFYQLKKEMLVGEQLLPTLVSNLRQVCPDAAPFAQRMMDSLASYTDEELAVEYARLFVGPFGLKAPPYGSIYLDNDHTVMGPSTIETISFYEVEGLTRDEGFHELPDHIAVEMEFMYYLIYREVETLQKNDKALAETYHHKQEQFRVNFLSKWVPQFCQNIINETDNSFYKALAECVTTFVKAS